MAIHSQRGGIRMMNSPKTMRMKKMQTRFVFFSLVYGWCVPRGVFAVSTSTGIDVSQMLINIQEEIPYLTRCVTAFAYLSGFYFIYSGLYKLKEYGEARTMMSSNTDLRRPLVFLMTGASFIYLPTMVTVGLITVYGDKSMMQYEVHHTVWDGMAQTMVQMIYFIGGLAFIRGLLHLHRAGTTQQQPGAVPKGLFHLIGGTMAMNMVEVTNMVFATLGIV